MAFRGPIRYSLANFLLLEVDKHCSIMGKVLFGAGISIIVSLKETIEHNMQGLAKSGQQNTKWKKNQYHCSHYIMISVSTNNLNGVLVHFFIYFF